MLLFTLPSRTQKTPSTHPWSCPSSRCCSSPDDLAAIKLLKRKLAVAISEEDYQAAASIRDHPFMRLHKEVVAKK
jgi:hypothetical protein